MKQGMVIADHPVLSLNNMEIEYKGQKTNVSMTDPMLGMFNNF